MTAKTWFITGASRGFGREWALAALGRGDRVAAPARDPATLADLVDKYGAAVLPLQLDVTDRGADFAAVAAPGDVRCLDVGAGNGVSGDALRAAHLTPVVAVDVSPVAKAAAERAASLHARTVARSGPACRGSTERNRVRLASAA